MTSVSMLLENNSSKCNPHEKLHLHDQTFYSQKGQDKETWIYTAEWEDVRYDFKRQSFY